MGPIAVWQISPLFTGKYFTLYLLHRNGKSVETCNQVKIQLFHAIFNFILGVGVSMTVLSSIVGLYYIVIICKQCSMKTILSKIKYLEVELTMQVQSQFRTLSFLGQFKI